jgi:hypothetical protein
MKNAIFWDVTPFGSYKNRLSGERIASIIWETRIGALGTTVNLPSSPILVFLMMEIRFSETSVLTRATRSHPRRRHSS